MNDGKSSIHDVLGRLKVERPECSYVRKEKSFRLDARDFRSKTRLNIFKYKHERSNTGGEFVQCIHKHQWRTKIWDCETNTSTMSWRRWNGTFFRNSHIVFSVANLSTHRWRYTKRALHRKEENNKVKMRFDFKKILVEFRTILSDTRLKWIGCSEVYLGVYFLDIHAIVKIRIQDPKMKRNSLRDLPRITFREDNMKAVHLLVEAGRKPVIPKVCSNLFFVVEKLTLFNQINQMKKRRERTRNMLRSSWREP